MNTDEGRQAVEALAPLPALCTVTPKDLLHGHSQAIGMPPTAPVSELGVPCLSPNAVDLAWVEVLANIVLRIRAEGHHVY